VRYIGLILLTLLLGCGGGPGYYTTPEPFEDWSQHTDGWNPALDNPEPKSSYRTEYRYRDNYNYSGDTDSFGTPVYSPDECIGPIIMGECHGTVLPKAGYRKKCYGTMLNGRCTGPMY